MALFVLISGGRKSICRSGDKDVEGRGVSDMSLEGQNDQDNKNHCLIESIFLKALSYTIHCVQNII